VRSSRFQIEKTVVEGGGRFFAAVLSPGDSRPARRAGVVRGNIDRMTLSSILQRGLVRSHRLVRLKVELPDVPGALGQITNLLGELDSNIVDIVHQRAFGGSSARAAIVELTLQLRGEEQAERVVDALSSKGFDAELMI
jgi:threonine dehydratase